MSVRMGPSGQVPHLMYPFVGGNHRRLVGRLELGSEICYNVVTFGSGSLRSVTGCLGPWRGASIGQ